MLVWSSSVEQTSAYSRGVDARVEDAEVGATEGVDGRDDGFEVLAP
jgi:hypothetical protein